MALRGFISSHSGHSQAVRLELIWGILFVGFRMQTLGLGGFTGFRRAQRIQRIAAQSIGVYYDIS